MDGTPDRPQTSPDSTQPSHQPSDSQTTPSPLPNSIPASDSPPHPEDRSELISRARIFLTSPQVQSRDVQAKRRFLAEKGLTQPEIDGLLHELLVQMPAVPPRTYPQPPPSNLPNLFIGMARLFSWIAGSSAALIFIYYRFLLPRITQSSLARRALKSHQLSLLQNFTKSLASFKESQAESFSALPRPQPFKEPIAFGQLHSIGEILKEAEAQELEVKDVPTITLLRCGIEEFGKGKEAEGDGVKPTTVELFRLLETAIPWLVSEDGLQFENELWSTLSTCPVFQSSSPLPSSSASTSTTPSEPQPSSSTQWTYQPPPAPKPWPFLASLKSLSSSLPTPPNAKHQGPHQRTLHSLTDLTGYITTQMYMSHRSLISEFGVSGLNGGGLLSSVEEDLRREIRALKGLGLNRRSFMPPVVRSSSASTLQPAS